MSQPISLSSDEQIIPWHFWNQQSGQNRSITLTNGTSFSVRVNSDNSLALEHDDVTTCLQYYHKSCLGYFTSCFNWFFSAGESTDIIKLEHIYSTSTRNATVIKTNVSQLQASDDPQMKQASKIALETFTVPLCAADVSFNSWFNLDYGKCWLSLEALTHGNAISLSLLGKNYNVTRRSIRVLMLNYWQQFNESNLKVQFDHFKANQLTLDDFQLSQLTRSNFAK
ncbi:MAG: hypothetical protein ACPGUD_12875 [Parashewanella sp.]